VKARARTVGIYQGHRVRAGAVVEIKDGEPLPSWLEPADAPLAPTTKSEEPTTFSQINKSQEGFAKTKI